MKIIISKKYKQLKNTEVSNSEYKLEEIELEDIRLIERDEIDLTKLRPNKGIKNKYKVS